jgi:hypothetical protein
MFNTVLKCLTLFLKYVTLFLKCLKVFYLYLTRHAKGNPVRNVPKMARKCKVETRKYSSVSFLNVCLLTLTFVILRICTAFLYKHAHPKKNLHPSTCVFRIFSNISSTSRHASSACFLSIIFKHYSICRAVSTLLPHLKCIRYSACFFCNR